MKLKSKQCILDLIECNSFWSQFRGLMFSKPKDLVFDFGREGIFPIHMLFVFFPIDLVYLDSSFRVVGVKKQLKPFTLFFKGWKCRYLLELRNSKDIAIGDVFFKVFSESKGSKKGL